ANFLLCESTHFGSSAPVGGLDLPPAAPGVSAPPPAAPGIVQASGQTVVIDTDNLTVTGDGDGDPHKFYGQPFTASGKDGPIPFVVPANTVGQQTSFQGTLGLEFDTNTVVEVTSLGVFDSGSDGLKRAITATLY